MRNRHSHIPACLFASIPGRHLEQHRSCLQAFVAIFATATWALLARLPTGAARLSRLSFLPKTQALLATTADGRLLKWRDAAALNP